MVGMTAIYLNDHTPDDDCPIPTGHCPHYDVFPWSGVRMGYNTLSLLLQRFFSLREQSFWRDKL
jgi:hypothetical protein